jgi:hypothetical protein
MSCLVDFYLDFIPLLLLLSRCFSTYLLSFLSYLLSFLSFSRFGLCLPLDLELVLFLVVIGFSSPQGASSCMANSCTPTQVSHSDFAAAGSITGITGDVSNCLRYLLLEYLCRGHLFGL